MKLVLALICAIIGFVSAANLGAGTQWYATDGQPFCNQVGVAFRNNWDPTKFWLCIQANKNAVLKGCPDELPAFLGSSRKCVTWEEYKWEVPVVPESPAKKEL